MKKLMNTLYITSEDSYLDLDGKMERAIDLFRLGMAELIEK